MRLGKGFPKLSFATSGMIGAGLCAMVFASACAKGGSSVTAGTTGSGARDLAMNPPAPTIAAPANPLNGNLRGILLLGGCVSGDIVYVEEVIGGATQTPVTGTCSGGAFLFPLNQAADGVFSYNVYQQGVFNGEVLPAFSPKVTFNWTLDATPPAAPTITSPATNPYGSSGNSVTIVGTCENGDTVYLGGASTQQYTCASNSFTFTYNNSNDGSYDFTLLERDSFGNGASGPNFTWVRELKPPVVFVTNPASSPVTTNIQDFTLAGTCKAGYTVTLAGVTGASVTTPAGSLTQTCTAGNTFSYVIRKTTDATYNLSVTQTNPLVGTPSDPASVAWTLDTAPPLAPTVTNLSGLNPYFSNLNSVTIFGGCESGAMVYLTGDSTQNVLCNGSSVYSFTVAKSVDATYNFALKQTDAASNTSPQIAQSWVRDTLVPAPVTRTTPASNPYTSNEAAITISGSCEDFATVYLTGASAQQVVCSGSTYSFNYANGVDGTYNFTLYQTDRAANSSTNLNFQWIRDSGALAPPTIANPVLDPYYSNSASLVLDGTCDATGTVYLAGDVVVGEVISPAGSLSQACAGGVYSFTISKSTDGTYNIGVYQIASAKTSATVSRSWTLDRVTPATPTIIAPATSPYYSALNLLTISGACEPAATVQLSGSSIQNMTCSGGSAYSFSVNQTVDGTYNFSVSQSDLAGNISGSASQIWTRDTLTPSPVIILNPASSPFVSSSNPVVSGTCETGNIVRINDVAAGTNQTMVCAASAFSFGISKSVDGTYDYTLIQTDGAGNASSAVAFQWIRDTSIPPTPLISAPATTPYYSNTNTINITATCVSGNDVFLDGDDVQGPVACPGGGTVTFTTATFSTDNTYAFFVSQENPATGLVSAESSINWVRDTAAPANPTRLNPNITPYTSSGSLLVQGACEAGAMVNITGAVTIDTPCSTSGTYSTTVSSLADGGPYNFTVKQTDLAGNQSNPGITFAWTRNSALPPTPTITNPTVNPVISAANSQIISGGCLTGYNVILTDVGTGGTTTQTCSSSSYSFTVNKAVDGAYSFNVKQNNGGSNSGAIGLQWIRDAAPPVVTITASPANPNLVWVPSFTFSATESVTFQCSLDGGAFSTCISPLNYSSGLSNAAHTFEVKGTDSAGNVSNTASHTWTQAAYKTIGLYHLDSAAPAVDSCSYTGANNNLFTVNTNTTSVAGKYSEARSFAGNGIMSAVDSGSLSTVKDKLTVEAWVKFSNLTTTYSVIAGQHNSANQGWELRAFLSSGRLKLRFYASSGPSAGNVVTTGRITYSNTTWYHVAATYDAGVVRIYLDGVQKKSTTLASKSLNNSSAPLRVGEGESGATNALTGVIDELRISQVNRYPAPFTPAASAFVAD